MSDRSHHWMARLQTPDGPRGYESCGPRNSVPRTVLKASTVMPRDRSMPLTPDGRRGETDQASQHKTNFCSMAVGPQTVARFFLYSHFALSFLLEGHKRLKWNEQIIHSLIDWMNNLITHLYVVKWCGPFRCWPQVSARRNPSHGAVPVPSPRMPLLSATSRSRSVA